MLNRDDIFVAKADLMTRESDEELVAMPDQGEFVVLNATGTRVLQLGQSSMPTFHKLSKMYVSSPLLSWNGKSSFL